jgi:cytochrome d ubiquinol oxidase subunit I
MNWSAYSRYVGDVFGAPLAIEGLAAFFLESTFIGLWLFGRGRMRPGVHLATIWLVAIGTVLSATFIIAANSWMQRPSGSEVVDGKAELVDIGAVLTNPLFILALPHTVFAALLTGGVIVVAISAWQLRRSNEVDLFTRSLRMALPVVLVSTLLVFLSGDEFARRLIEWQPMKMAAAEALFETEQPASLSLFATGDFEGNPGETNRNVKIPHLLSLIATLSWDGEVKGINEIQAEYEERYGPGDYVPIVGVAYWSFRIMITCALALIALSLAGLWFARKRKLHTSRRFLWLAVAAALLPFLGNTAGWVLAEMGRQPWVVQGLLFTRDGVSPNVSTAEAATTLILLVGVYSLLAAVAGWLVLREMRHGPPPAADDRPDEASPDLSLAY